MKVYYFDEQKGKLIQKSFIYPDTLCLTCGKTLTFHHTDLGRGLLICAGCNNSIWAYPPGKHEKK